jgi:hypothetical protein
MEERIVSKQTIHTLVLEIQQTLLEVDSAYPKVIQALKKLDPFLNLKNQTSIHVEAGTQALSAFKEESKNFQTQLDRTLGAYDDLFVDLQSALGGRSPQDILLQELGRQGSALAHEINLRQEAARIFNELVSVLDRITAQEKSTPAQQKKIEDLVFRLQVLS